MRAFIRLVLAVASAFVFSTSVVATSFSTDNSDLWFNPAESGWGMQLVQQGSFIFATLFVYGPAGQPTWVTAQMQSVGNLVWSGPLYVTTGPYFGGAFNPNLVTVRQAGTMTWQPTAVAAGTVTYSVDGVPVSKNVVRQFLQTDNYNGAYITTFNLVASNCFNPGLSGSATGAVAVAISQGPSTASVFWNYPNGVSCSLPAGIYQQAGHIGAISGNYSCNTGEVGSIQFFELTNRINMVSGRIAGGSSNLGCSYSGHFTGLVPFNG